MAKKDTSLKNIDGFKHPSKSSDKKKSFAKDSAEAEKDSIKEFSAKSEEDSIKESSAEAKKDSIKDSKKIEVKTSASTVAVTEGDYLDEPPADLPVGLNNEKTSPPPVEDSEEAQAEDTKENTKEDLVEGSTEAQTKTPTESSSEISLEDLADTPIEDLIKASTDDLPKEHEESLKPEKPKEKENTQKDQKKSKKHAKKPKATALPYRIISRIIAFLAIGSLGAFITYAALTGAFPFKYLIVVIIVSVLLSFLLLFKAFRRKTHIISLTIFNFIGLCLIAASTFGFLKFNEIINSLDNSLKTSDVEYSIYNIIVSKTSSYSDLDSVKGKEFHSIANFIDTAKLESAVKDQLNGTVAYTDGLSSMLQSTISSPTYISLLNSGTYAAAIDADKDNTYSGKLKIIGEIKVKADQNTAVIDSASSLTTKSWIMYISGIDTRSNQMLDKSLSDVNIIMAINPTTKYILMVAIPRDYYVQLHNTTGLPDKLTHAGALGGLGLSIATIEDLLGLDINQYLRVNFNALIKLVDVIGGITVISDVNYSFKCYTDPSCVIEPGANNLDGECALAFARERYAYSTGDRHRGENQEQVIARIFEKIASNNTLISRYSGILNALSGSFETSLTTSDIASLVNMQLDDMAKWTIESYNLNGTTGMAYTYSYPGQQLSVMYPDATIIETAKQKINAVLSGTTTGKK